jgi:hypothetical protein
VPRPNTTATLPASISRRVFIGDSLNGFILLSSNPQPEARQLSV